jgi:hypothetical protein
MSFRFLLFITRKPTLTPAEFQSHWDTKHVELLKSIAGDAFPLTHTRHYIRRTAHDSSWPAAVLVGTQEDFTYDGIAELVFPSEAAFQTFFSICFSTRSGSQNRCRRINLYYTGADEGRSSWGDIGDSQGMKILGKAGEVRVDEL